MVITRFQKKQKRKNRKLIIFLLFIRSNKFAQNMKKIIIKKTLWPNLC